MASATCCFPLSEDMATPLIPVANPIQYWTPLPKPLLVGTVSFVGKYSFSTAIAILNVAFVNVTHMFDSHAGPKDASMLIKRLVCALLCPAVEMCHLQTLLFEKKIICSANLHSGAALVILLGFELQGACGHPPLSS